MNQLLWLERTVSEGGGSGTGTSPLNIVFIVALALFISWLATRLAGRGRKK